MSYTFTTLGSPSSSATDYQYTGVNSSGEMVGWYTDSSGDDFGFLYNGSTYTSLTEPSAQGSPPVVTKAFGINDNGQVVGYYVSLDPLVAQGNNQFGFQYSSGTYTSLPWPPNNPPGSASVAEATGINKAGQIVGWYQSAGGIEHSFLYSGGSYTVLDAPGGTGSTYAEGINDNGQIVGYYTNAHGVTHGFLYTVSNGSYTTLDDPSEGSGGATYAYGINDSGQIVGYYAVPAEAGTLAFGFFPHGFMYSGGTFTTIDDPAGSNTEIFGISNSGAIVGSFSGGSFVASSSSQPPPPPPPPPPSPPAVNLDEWILANGHWASSISPGSHPGGYAVAGVGDWTGKGTDGVLWYDSSTGDVDEWQLSGGKWTASVDLGTHPANSTNGSSYQIAEASDFTDFTGNGIDDVLWTSPNSNGTTATDIWELGSNGKWAASVSPGSHPAGYSVAGTGNWTGSGTDGILWFNSTTGDVDEWQLSGGKWAASVDLGTHPGDYQISGIGDFFGNGRDDILWTSVNSNGTISTDIWELNPSGKWMASVSPGVHPAGYQVVAIGDFAGNSTDGILWYNATTGDVDEWQIANGKWAASVDLGTHPGSFQIAGVGNLIGNSTSDIVWHS